MLIGLVTEEEGEGEEGKSHSKVGTRWVRQRVMAGDVSLVAMFFTFWTFMEAGAYYVAAGSKADRHTKETRTTWHIFLISPAARRATRSSDAWECKPSNA